MKRSTLFQFFSLLICLATIAFIYGCGSAASSTSGTPVGGNRAGTFSYAGTQSPGDVWSWTISSETFIGSNETDGSWVTGEWTTLSTGFGKAHIINSNIPAQIDGYAYFLEFPNTMLLVRPDDASSSRVMVCAASATLEPGYPSHFLFVNLTKDNWQSSTDGAYGTVEATYTGGKWHFDVTNYLITGEVESHVLPTDNFAYLSGTFSNESGHATKIFLTPSNVFFGDMGPNDGGFAGASLESLSTSEFSAALNHTYKGVRFVHYPGAGGTAETEPITCSKHPTMEALLGNSYSNIETGTLMGGGVIITFEATQANGFKRAVAYDVGSGQSELLQCSFSRIGPSDNKKYMFYGVGMDSWNRSFNFLIIQTD
jgi:hypothetical protein